jgi:2-(1,2-epoxy-1,2-dihydrophenyl)acetyl-CoA isomerase
MSFKKLRYTLEGNIAVIAMNDEATLNAAGVDMIAELREAFAQAVNEARCAILTGEGRGFSSGANLSGRGAAPAAAAPAPGSVGALPDAGAALETIYNPFVLYLRDLPIPFVTAVNGAAAGVGCSLALMGDLILAGESAYFLQAFRRIGLVPDGGSSYLLPRMIGRARAMEMMLLGERVPAKKAEEWGLINRCVADGALMTEAKALARQLADGPASIAMIRRLSWDSLDAHFRDQLHNERVIQRDASRTADSREGILAFLQKRPAKFTGA